MPILHEHIEGKYEILGKLREGGMGAVYKVRHRLLDEVLVVKVLNPRLDVTPELSGRFLREARFAIQLRHPNIAQLNDFSIAEDGSAFIVMEFIDGATLEEIVARTGPPPLGLGLEIARQSLKALGFLHRRGLIHRDISPDNLMLTRDAEGGPLVKLIDLGIAKVLKGGAGGLTSTGMFLGKPRYASPEQFSAAGLSGADARADLYSFGVVLYELLTGTCPIQGRDPGSLMAGHLFRPPVDFAESDPDGRLPADLRAILLRVLAKVPDERFATAEELARALGEVQDRFPVKPGELDAILAAAAAPAPPTPSPGTTQGKLDQQFAKVATPAPTLRSEPRRDSTLVLGSQERPAVPVETIAETMAETMAMPREVVPAPVAEVVRPVPAAPAAAPPPISRPVPTAPKVEALRPIRQPVRPPERRRFLVPLVAAILLIAIVAVGLELWWLWHRGSFSETDASVMSTTTQPSAPVGQVAVVSPPATQPAVNEVAVSTPPAVEPTPTIEVPRPHQEKPKKPEDQSVYISAASVEEFGESLNLGAQIKSISKPSFPTEYLGTGSYARIIVSVQIDAEGRVINTRIKSNYRKVNGADHGLSPFTEAAQEAAKEALFEPAYQSGMPVPSRVELTFEFGKKPKG